MIRIHVSKKELQKAHDLCDEQLERIIDDKKATAIIYSLKAQLFIVENNLEKAKFFYSKAIDANPQYTEANNALAKIYLENKENDKALKQYQSYLKINPNNLFIHMMIGTLYDKEKKHELAADHYKEILKLNPDYAPAQNNLAYHYIARTNEVEKAFELARKAKESYPEDPVIADTLGLVYSKKELYGNAEREFKDALNKLPNNADVHFHLGLMYAEKGEKRLSIKSITKALELDKEFDGHNEAQQLLNALQGS